MKDFLRTAFYSTNLPALERALRLLGGAGVAAVGWMGEHGGMWTLGWLVSGVGLALTGLVGFCPACYLAGRRLKSRRAARGA